MLIFFMPFFAPHPLGPARVAAVWLESSSPDNEPAKDPEVAWFEKLKPALPLAPTGRPVIEVNVTTVLFSFAVPALPVHLMDTDPLTA